MVAKVRKQIYVEAYQEAALKRVARQLGTSEAEIIRQAIDRQTGVLRFPAFDLSAWAVESAFIADLMCQGPVPGARHWQREDLHER